MPYRVDEWVNERYDRFVSIVLGFCNEDRTWLRTLCAVGEPTNASDSVSRETIRYDLAGSFVTLALDRPDQLSAFTVDMADGVVAAFEKAAAHPRIAAIVVAGSGRAVCGHGPDA